MSKVKWDNIKKQYYVADKDENGRVIIRKPTPEEMEETGWRSSFDED